jgi:hypothetical protein
MVATPSTVIRILRLAAPPEPPGVTVQVRFALGGLVAQEPLVYGDGQEMAGAGGAVEATMNFAPAAVREVQPRP